MKRFFTLLILALALASCSETKLAQTYDFDLSKYYDKGILITIGDLDNYVPISLIKTISYKRNVWDEKNAKLNEKPATLEEAMDLLCKRSIELGANAVINIKIDYRDDNVIVTGMAVKLNDTKH